MVGGILAHLFILPYGFSRCGGVWRGYPVHPFILKILIQTLVVCGRGHPAHPKILKILIQTLVVCGGGVSCSSIHPENPDSDISGVWVASCPS